MHTAIRTVSVSLLFAVAACKGTSKEASASPATDPAVAGNARAVANIEPRSGSSLSGKAEFVQKGNQVTLTVHVSALRPSGVHGIHLHETGDCGAADASSAGAHWNPKNAPHGKLDGAPSHLGDVGNIEITPQGGKLTFTTNKWSIGTGQPNDVVGKALIIHAQKDDLVSQPAGNSGARVGCGVIQIAH